MNNVVPTYSAASTIFSVAALALVVPVQFIFRQNYRSLDFLQMSYIFAGTMFKASFSNHLSISFASFPYNFLSFCQSGDLVCTLGFQLSFGAVLIGFLLMTALFIGLQRCCGKKLEMEPIYSTFKGFFRWFYLPATYHSAHYLALALEQSFNQSNTNLTNIIWAASIAGFCFVFPILQLLAYKCIQTE